MRFFGKIYVVENRLKEYREKNNKKIKDVASYVGKNRDTYSFYETEIDKMSIKTLLKLCNLYGVTPNDLLGYNDLSSEETKQKILYDLLIQIDEILKK